MYTYKVAGIFAIMEKEIMEVIAQKINYHNFSGNFNVGGSISNLNAILCAKINRDKRNRVNRKYRFYTSELGHYSLKKNMLICGFEERNLVKIGTVDGKIDLLALEQKILEDKKKGTLPFFLNITYATTVLGDFDRFFDIIDLCKQENIWIHIDACFGTSALFAKQFKYLRNELKFSNSITLDFHKTIGVPLTASLLLVNQKKNILTDIFSSQSNYLYQDEEENYNLGESSIQCGRRCDSFKVWSLLKLKGIEFIGEKLTQQIALRDQFLILLKQHKNFTLVKNPEFLNVCFTYNTPHHRICAKKICTKLNTHSLIKIGYGEYNNKKFIRFPIINTRLSLFDLKNILTKIEEVSQIIIAEEKDALIAKLVHDLKIYFKDEKEHKDLKKFAETLQKYDFSLFKDCHFEENKYFRKVLFSSKEFDIVFFIWGKKTQIKFHNHPENGCLMNLLMGSMREHRMDAKNLKEVTITLLKEGIHYLIKDELHALEIIENSISIHIYSPGEYQAKFMPDIHF